MNELERMINDNEKMAQAIQLLKQYGPNKLYAHDNGMQAAGYLKKSKHSDEIWLDHDSYMALKEFREKMVGDDVDLISDVIWSGTIPLKDFIVSVTKEYRIRFCIFDESLEHLEEVPEGKVAMVGALQEMRDKTFWLLGVTKGENKCDMSLEYFSQDGVYAGETQIFDVIKELWKMWHGIQLALLHPQTKEVFANPQKVKERRKAKEDGKKKRETWYVRRHVINGEDMKHTMREIQRHCQCWYVIGHWRHYKNGRTVYIDGYWKGPMRETKGNLDSGRNRKVV